MNDLLRPALYDAWHAVEPVVARAGDERTWNVVGPICESGDFLAKDRILDLREGDLLAIRHAGAYGFALASNYNSRPRCPELLVDGKVAHVIRHRESLHDRSISSGLSEMPQDAHRFCQDARLRQRFHGARCSNRQSQI